MKTLPLALAAALALPSAALPEEPDDGTRGPRARTSYDLRVRLLGGAFDGEGVRRESGAVLALETDLEPKLRAGHWTLRAPLRLDHRETPGADLRETVLGAGLDASWSATPRLRLGPVAEVTYTWRPGWKELYQRTGEPATTDRYSRLQWRAGAELWQSFEGGHHLRADVAWVATSYARSPDFDETDATPSHLVPADNGQLRFGASYRVLRPSWSATLRADGYVRKDEVLLARNATTGGLTSTNPLQELVGGGPTAKVSVKVGPGELSAAYGLVVQSDRFQGYYSWTGHDLSVGWEQELSERLSMEVKASGWFQGYGANSRSGVDGNGNTRTEDGERLQYRRFEAGAELSWKLGGGLALVAEADLVRRTTNYPDYVPGTYPSATSVYDIRWDFTNWRVLAGVEWRPDLSPRRAAPAPAERPATATPPAAGPAPAAKDRPAKPAKK